jgi:hypothetical protein
MTVYRIYSVDRAGKITDAEALVARTPDEAFDRARAISAETDCEIWNRSKLVGVCRRWVGKERYI